MKFEQWLGTLLQQDELEIRRLLNDQTALHFLIAWSLFESKCFSGFVKIDRIEAFARNAVADGFDSGSIRDAATHFHARYQDGDRYRQLMHSQKCPRMDALLQRKVQALSPEESLFFVTLIVYRFRNNMFHGNKKVQSWLQYKEQIRLCTDAMEQLVSHAEARRPSLPERRVA